MMKFCVALFLSLCGVVQADDRDITVDGTKPLDYAAAWGIGENPGNGMDLDPNVADANWCDPSYPNQSPIDLHDDQITSTEYTTEPMKITLDTVTQTKMALTSNGVELEMEGHWLTLEHEGQTYKATQLHFHSPSEHVFNGYYCAGEIHIVMNNVDASIPAGHPNGHAVFGMCLQMARQSNPFFEQIENLLSSIDGGPQSVVPGWTSEPLLGWDIRALRPIMEENYISYVGSYTTPACDPNINWFLFTTPVHVTIFMIEFMQGRFEQPANHRPTQAMGDRVVTYTHICDCAATPADYTKASTRSLMFGLKPIPDDKLVDGCAKACP